MRQGWLFCAGLMLWSASALAAEPSRFPFLPYLIENHDPKLCQAFEAAQQTAFKSTNPTISAVDQPWPGLDMQWVFSPRTVEGLNTSDLRLTYPADLDGDGTSEILLLTGAKHSWRGDMFSLVRFDSEAALKAFDDRQDKDSRGTGTSLLVRASGDDSPFPWDWHVPSLMTADGRYYLLDEGAVWENTPVATLYRIPAKGKPEPICAVERAPNGSIMAVAEARSALRDEHNALAAMVDRIGVGPLFADLTAMLGTDGACGTLNPVRGVAIRAARARIWGLFRPWAKVPHIYSDNTRPVVDRALALWATDSLRNWRLYAQFQEDEQQALQALTAWYREAFGMDNAEAEASRVLDLMIRSHFVFTAYASVDKVPKPSPLSLALLQGKPVEEVRSLLALVDLENPVDDSTVQDAPLVLAIGHPHLVQLLLEAGAPVNAANVFGKTPLMYAAQYDDAESVAMLLAAGADVNARTTSVDGCGLDLQWEGRTALHYAAENAGLEVIRRLLAAGADATAKLEGGDNELPRTPLSNLSRNTKLSEHDRAEATILLHPVP